MGDWVETNAWNGLCAYDTKRIIQAVVGDSPARLSAGLFGHRQNQSFAQAHDRPRKFRIFLLTGSRRHNTISADLLFISRHTDHLDLRNVERLPRTNVG